MTAPTATCPTPTDAATPRAAAPSVATSRATAGPLLPVVGSDTLVPLVDGRSVTYANLDVAASAPALRTVADRVTQVLPLYASVHRGAGYLSQVSTTLYEVSRRTIGEFVGARADDVTVITRNTTDSTNLLAGCVPDATDGRPGRVLVLDAEHHANLLPWQRSTRATVLEAQPSVVATLAVITDALRSAAADGDPFALLAITGASNVTGESLPLDAVAAAAHEHGTRVLVDGAQLVPHRRFSLDATGVDFVAFSGHKTYAPFGSGALVGRRDWLDTGTPYLAGGGAVRNVALDEVAWQSAPARHEAGSPNVIGAVALASACEALAAVDAEDLLGHERALRERLVAGLSAVPGVRVVRVWADAVDPVGVVTFAVEDHDPGFVAAYLAAEHGIGVRDGRFCAHPLLRRLGYSSGAIRASVGVGTSGEEVERLLAALEQFVTDGPVARYAVVDGCWAVQDDPRPLPEASGLSGLVATAAAGFVAESAGCGPEIV